MFNDTVFSLIDFKSNSSFYYQIGDYEAKIVQNGQAISNTNPIYPTNDLRIDFSMTVKSPEGSKELTPKKLYQIVEFESKKLLSRFVRINNEDPNEKIDVALRAYNIGAQANKVSFSVNPLFKEMNPTQVLEVVRRGTELGGDAEKTVCSLNLIGNPEVWAGVSASLPPIPIEYYTHTLRRETVAQEVRRLRTENRKLQAEHLKEIEEKNALIQYLWALVVQRETELLAAKQLLQYGMDAVQLNAWIKNQDQEIQQLRALVLQKNAIIEEMEANPVKFLKTRTIAPEVHRTEDAHPMSVLNIVNL